VVFQFCNTLTPQVKNVTELLDSMVNLLVVDKPKYPVAHLAKFLKMNYPEQFAMALKPNVEEQYNDDEAKPPVLQGYADDPNPGQDPDVEHSRLPLSANLIHGDRMANEEAERAKQEAEAAARKRMFANAEQEEGGDAEAAETAVPAPTGDDI
jgi:putative N-acetylmannosamine-6-phosphate epimerase